MNRLDEHSIDCPYCGESITILLEPSSQTQSYTEDCQVCCRPIVVAVSGEFDGTTGVVVSREDD